MKHLIILVIATLSLSQSVKAQGQETPQLPSKISIHDREMQSWPLVISKSKTMCDYCDPDTVLQPSFLVFKDTSVMKTLKEITGINFTKLRTRLWYDGADKEYQKIMHAGSFGQHSLTWHLERPEYKVSRKTSYSYCSIFNPEGCDYPMTWTCQLIKSQTVKMRVLHNTYTEFISTESKIISEWGIGNDEQCSVNKLIE